MHTTSPLSIDLEKQLGVVCISLPTPFPVGPVNVFLVKQDPPILIDTGLNSDESYDTLAVAPLSVTRPPAGSEGLHWLYFLQAGTITRGDADYTSLAFR